MDIFNLMRRTVNFLERKIKGPVNKKDDTRLNPYLRIGNSLLFDNFSLSPRIPVENKVYLTIGNDSMVGGQFMFESSTGEVIIGNRVYLAGGHVICTNKIVIEDEVFISWGVYFFDNDSHSLDYRDRIQDMTNHLNDWRSGKTNYNISKDWSNVRSAPIRVCRYAWIGMEVKILKGVTIGEGAIVGSGSVVTKDVAPWTVVAGNPAKVIKTLDHKAI